MSPDLEWRVDDPAGEQVIARTPPPRGPRWRRWAIGLAVMLGIGLGVIYRSIPEPARPAPTPTVIPAPTPDAMPIALYQTIGREAEALADGDRATFDRILDIQDFIRYRALLDSFAAWGRPTGAALYSILDYRQIAADKAWVTIKQFRVDDYVQETRFYHLRNGQWRRTDFDPSFWSGLTETSDTPHFHFTYYVEDYDLIEPLATLLEADYEQLCTDFACPTAPMTCIEAFGKPWCSSFPREVAIRFNLNAPADQTRFDIAENDELVFILPSPRQPNQLSFAEQQSDLRNPSAWLQVMRLAYGRVDVQGAPPPGQALVIAIFFREYTQVLKRTGGSPLVMPEEFTQLDTANLPPLERLWLQAHTADSTQAYAAAHSVVTYLEAEFGWPAVVTLLKTIGSSQSLAEAIETSTGISYVAFEERWQAWVKSTTSTAQ